MRRPGEDETDAVRRTKSLAALAATLGLVVAALYLVSELRHSAAVQDCVLSGRAGCLIASSR